MGLFFVASFIMVWRLECMSRRGFGGTALGTLVMPYCSGLGNLMFVFVIGMNRGPGKEVLVNSLVNNVTNLTLLLGLPAIFWGMTVVDRKCRLKKEVQSQRINRLSLLLTIAAVLFFTGAVWALAQDGVLDFGDGLVLIGLFVFWQAFQVYDVLKTNLSQKQTLSCWLLLDFAILMIGAVGLFVSIEWLVEWISGLKSGFVSADQMGWLSGWLMVLPNALLALYYGWKRQADIVYSSQIGDGHICIPLCIGLSALLHSIEVPEFLTFALIILAVSAIVHVLLVGLLGRLPRWIGGALILAYGVFVYKGLIA
jgi:cation:H+ antiporter